MAVLETKDNAKIIQYIQECSPNSKFLALMQMVKGNFPTEAILMVVNSVKGLNVNALDDHKRGLLHVAKNPALIEFLHTKLGCNLDVRAVQGNSPMAHHILHNNEPCALKLAELGAKECPLDLAFEKKMYLFIKFWSMKYPGRIPSTKLVLEAVKRGDYEMLLLFLPFKKALEATDINGNNALNLAASMGRPLMIEALIKARCPLTKNKDGMTALDILKQNSPYNPQLAQYIAPLSALSESNSNESSASAANSSVSASSSSLSVSSSSVSASSSSLSVSSSSVSASSSGVSLSSSTSNSPSYLPSDPLRRASAPSLSVANSEPRHAMDLCDDLCPSKDKAPSPKSMQGL
jgi:hypothetical protein